MKEGKLRIIISSLKQLPQVAEDILTIAGNRKLFSFKGPLGSGKTTIIKMICKKLGAENQVTSPSFTLVNEYLTRDGNILYHIDLYRIKSINEAYDIGIEEYIYSNSYCFIEWPEIIQELLPPDSIKIKITTGNKEKRILEFE